MTNTINTAAAVAADALISGFDWNVLENPATDFVFGEMKLLSDPCQIDGGTEHADEHDAASHITRLVYGEIDEMIEARDEAEADDDQADDDQGDDEDDEDEGVERGFILNVRKYRVIQDGRETQKVVSYLAFEHSGSCGWEFRAGEYDCRETTLENIIDLMLNEEVQAEFDEYADAYERDVKTVDELDLNDLDDAEFEIETEDGVEYLRRALVNHLTIAAAA
ncbi:hypothetical protein [Paracoccus sanguinis]|uniref:Uncharacterized protein n=1 Tax=Paracoccus sanguinis TaxID=1545044 RepID=A0A099GMG4_9RHOB|nr:hypothetical protein [Paracoccus sanguinis]KGJ23737.1 hypothetical protein IX56_00190 [Paracoccus sanguinis]